MFWVVAPRGNDPVTVISFEMPAERSPAYLAMPSPVKGGVTETELREEADLSAGPDLTIRRHPTHFTRSNPGARLSGDRRSNQPQFSGSTLGGTRYTHFSRQKRAEDHIPRLNVIQKVPA